MASPLPGGVAALVRFLFNLPSGLQITALVIGVLAGCAAAGLVWWSRRALRSWLVTRTRSMQMVLGAVALIVVTGAAGFGVVSWDYTQHNNGFCTGCHVMNPAFQRFTLSEHSSLQCHNCHQQSIFASMRQVYLWVAERPQAIGPHAPVPNRVCEQCHVTGQPEIWRRIRQTAGHRTHLESDSSTLRELMCVTCHGREVHHFVPVDSTCGQSGCHVTTTIVLGKMQGQTELHCVTCHQFTAEVPVLATRDSAVGTLVPRMAQCFSCHAMQRVLADFDPSRDPHGGTCGMCHNPHVQRVASEATKSCASAQCHVDWRAIPFHTGTRHVDVGSQCTMCHLPHAARVDPSDCSGCHAAVAARAGTPRSIRDRLRRVAPFDTSRVVPRRTSLAAPRAAAPALGGGFGSLGDVRGKGDLMPGRPPGPLLESRLLAVLPDSFSHVPHAKLHCLTCHTTQSGHGGLTFQMPRGCQLCHHQAPDTTNCVTCHRESATAAPLSATLRVAVGDRAPRARDVAFSHPKHAAVGCVACHTEPVTLLAARAVAACAECHDDHHTAARACVQCHAGGNIQQAHAPPVDAHVACNACHASRTVARLVPDRSFCLTCHQPQADHHYQDRECTVCHLGAAPAEARSRLARPGGDE